MDILSADARNFRPNVIRSFAKLMSDPSLISFAGGLPSPATFPAEQIAEIAATIVRERSVVALQYGPTLGLARLREFIASLCGERGIRSAADQVLVTTGSQQALNLVAHALLDPGDVVLVELPTYVGACSSFYGRRAELIGVAQDDDGVVPASVAETARALLKSGRKVKCLYTIPNFQNPSGRLMNQARRDELLEIASEQDFLIIEDDPYGELVYVEGADTTPMKARSESDRVIYMGSFSKVLAPGLRCGFVVAPEALLRTLELAKEGADLCSGMLDQSIVDEFCFRGLLAPQITAVRNFYRERRNTLISSLEEHFRGRAHWTSAEGGLFTFVTLADDRDTAEWVPRAISAGVAYIPGAPFFVDGSGQNSMRLTFAKEPDDRMREGVRRLANLFFEETS